MEIEFLTTRQVQDLIEASFGYRPASATLLRQMSDGYWPPPVRLSSRKLFWPRVAVEQSIAQKLRK